MTTTMTSARYADADGQAVSCELLMWDGRLDNHRELRLRYHHLPMEDRHHGSLACATYDEDGVRGLRRLIGDWSLVLRDRRTGEVVLASDFAGIRPLYYRVDDSNVCWSVSLASLRAHTGVDELDERYIAGFLTHGGSPTLTPYAGIKSVPPGYAVCISRRGTIIRRFWALDGHHEVRYRDERCYDEQLQSLFREAVAARLETTEPVVAELSGGCDSSAVVSMATNLIRSGAVTASRLTTISYVHQDSLDVPFIRAVEAFCGIEGVHLSTHATPLFSETQEGGATPQSASPLLCAAAGIARARGARMYLTGQAGDLLFGNWIDDSLQVARFIRRGRPDQAVVEALAWSKVTGVPVISILTRVCAAMLASVVTSPRLDPDTASFGNDKDSSLLPAFASRTGAHEPIALRSTDWQAAPVERRPHLQALAQTLEMRLLQPLEPMQDLGYTHPFMHRPLVEFLMSVPGDVLCAPGQPRRLMRRALAHLWPPALRARRSKSLLTGQFLDAFRPFATRLLTEPREWMVVERGWIDRDSVSSRFERLARGLECNAVQLRRILLLEHWLRRGWPRQQRSTANVRLVS